ncbi:MAG: nucleotidyltransferase family protein, partial [Chlorobiota bacterium]
SNINLKKLYEFHLKSESIATLAVQERKSSRKFLFDDRMVLCGWKNEKSGERIISVESKSELTAYSFSGIQIIDPKIFKYFPDKLIFSLVELYLNVSAKENVTGYVHNDDELMDVGKVENIKGAESFFG